MGPIPAAGPFRIREVAYVAGMRQATHAHEYMSVTLVLSGHFRERVLRAEEIGSSLEQRYTARLDSLVQGAAAARTRVVEDLDRRRARLAPLAHPLGDYAGVYVSPKFGTMDWRVVAGGLELRMGIASSRAEVFDVAKDQLRVEVAGGGQVATFEFAPSGGAARAVTFAGERFVRVARDR